MAAAYAYADGDGAMPREIETLRFIDRFGLGALGRPPGAGELRRMAMAENVIKAYQERNRAEDWATWAHNNPEKARLLSAAMGITTNGE